MSRDEETPVPSGELLPAGPEQSSGDEERSNGARESIQPLLRLMEDRIALDNRRLDLQEKALDVANAQGEREHRFYIQEQQMEAEAERQRFEFARRLAWCFFALGAIIIGVLLWMAFFGDDKQRAVAETLGKNGLIGLAGFGILSGLIRLLRSFIQR